MEKTDLFKGYSDEGFPLGSYAILVAAYFGLMAVGNRSLRKKRARIPERLDWNDFLLLAPATHKLSRIITKDWVTSPLRAPFTRYEKNAGGGELKESSRGQGMQEAVGDLLTCNYCIGPWVAGALVYGMASQPRETRLFASVFSLVAVSDFLHFAYQIAREKNTQAEQKSSSAA